MSLPNSQIVPIDKLSSVFSNTSSTYKFYWFLALLELMEDGNVHLFIGEGRLTLFFQISFFKYKINLCGLAMANMIIKLI
ncbi:hypothetical protein EV145_11243 [Flavobacterium sp. 245]|nr:hypothetical protein EV145_11243 [Flavobacterium sp. 245]